LLAPDSRE
jgi:hypothetical protein